VFHPFVTVEPNFNGVAIYLETTVAKQFPALDPLSLTSLINAHHREHFLRLHSILAIVNPMLHPTPSTFNEQLRYWLTQLPLVRLPLFQTAVRRGWDHANFVNLHRWGSILL
jgi:hypothetical protein